MRFLIMLAGALLALPAAVMLYFTSRTVWDGRHAVFAGGVVPDPLPNGRYRGSVPGYQGLAAAWAGKQFDAPNGTGTNLVRASGGVQETAPFRTYQDRSFRDPGQSVLRVDYDIPENPPWLRICTDELVQLEPGRLLGKAIVRLIPGRPLTMLFFELEAMGTADEAGGRVSSVGHRAAS
jgi:hypothetical protein